MKILILIFILNIFTTIALAFHEAMTHTQIKRLEEERRGEG